MTDLDEALAPFAVRFAPWGPSWEKGIDQISTLHSPATVAGATSRNFTETERELLSRGVDLIIGVPEIQALEAFAPADVVMEPSSSHSTGHYVVRRVPGPTYILTLSKEGENEILLEAERQPVGSPALWKISSPLFACGDCTVTANSKRSSFCVLRDGVEEAAIVYRKSVGNTQLRFFDVVMPALQRELGKRVPIVFNGHSYLQAQAGKEVVASDCVKLTVREPQLKDQRWVLMFNGRVKRSSGRNFILVHPEQPTREILLCGKSGVKEFVFDINWPMSILQGFGVYLTLFSKPKPN